MTGRMILSQEEAARAYAEWLADPVTVYLCAACGCPWMAHHTTGCVSCETACVHAELIPRGKGADLEAESMNDLIGDDDE